jgi:V/A-type H+-transporting ATPase subunit E
MAKEHKMSSGVQELITRLKDEGVKAGRDKAEKMVSDAQQKAAGIVAAARAEADELMRKTRAELESEKKAAEASLKTAIRDTELLLESDLKTGFAKHVKRLVSMELQDKEFMRQMILAVAGRASKDLPEGAKAELMVPSKLFTGDEKGTHLTEKGKESMHHLVLGIAGEMLRDGIEVKRFDTGEVGLRMRLVDEDLEIDLSGNALADVLLKYLLPRYRAIVAGVE